VAAAEQLEAAEDGLVAGVGEEERAAPAEDQAVGPLAPQRLSLAVGLDGAEDHHRARPPLDEDRRQGGQDDR
jgi:hypothetical protein